MVKTNIDVKLILKVLEIFEYVQNFNKDIISTSKDLHNDISDNIEKGFKNKIPLWVFGFLY